MADVHSKEVRSYNMSRIKGKDTQPEILTRRFLFSEGLRYQLHRKDLPGTPDLVFPKYNKIVFIHGCFWHGHEGCNFFVAPKTKTDWWMDKINKNKERDTDNILKLKKEGWEVIEIWECQLKPDKRLKTLNSLRKQIKNDDE